MGETDRRHRNEYAEPTKTFFFLGASNNALTALFAINVIFFLVIMTLQVGFYVGNHTEEYFYTNILQWFQLPASFAKLIHKPWTFFTYMFTETGSAIMRGVSNMIWLWAFGYILQQKAGNEKIIPIYIYGGLAGALFFIGAHYTIPPLANQREVAGIFGANAAVMAVAAATTMMVPNHNFFTQIRGGIPIWVLLGVYILIDFAGVASAGSAIVLSHIGGAIAGVLFTVFLRHGFDGSIWMNKLYQNMAHIFDPKASNVTLPKDKIFYNNGKIVPFSKEANITQKKLDEILDKINETGFESLTKEQKIFLQNASKDENI